MVRDSQGHAVRWKPGHNYQIQLMEGPHAPIPEKVVVTDSWDSSWRDIEVSTYLYAQLSELLLSQSGNPLDQEALLLQHSEIFWLILVLLHILHEEGKGSPSHFCVLKYFQSRLQMSFPKSDWPLAGRLAQQCTLSRSLSTGKSAHCLFSLVQSH